MSGLAFGIDLQCQFVGDVFVQSSTTRPIALCRCCSGRTGRKFAGRRVRSNGLMTAYQLASLTDAKSDETKGIKAQESDDQNERRTRTGVDDDDQIDVSFVNEQEMGSKLVLDSRQSQELRRSSGSDLERYKNERSPVQERNFESNLGHEVYGDDAATVMEKTKQSTADDLMTEVELNKETVAKRNNEVIPKHWSFLPGEEINWKGLPVKKPKKFRRSRNARDDDTEDDFADEEQDDEDIFQRREDPGAGRFS